MDDKSQEKIICYTGLIRYLLAELEKEVVGATNQACFGLPSPQEALLRKPIHALDLKEIRTRNCLALAGIHTIGELVIKQEKDLLKIRSFGRRSLRDIKEALDRIGLSLQETVVLPEDNPS